MARRPRNSPVAAVAVAATLGVFLGVRSAHVAFVGSPPTVSLRHLSPVVRYAEETATAVAEEVATDSVNKILMSVLTPEGNTVKEAVSEVVLPSASGQLGVLAGHAPMMTALDTGVLRYKKNNEWFPIVLLSQRWRTTG
eukprot:TRINITY_DN10107_c0_g1_i2.p1 TRINITY_DN10107_c0_g1~~TRINITY_DN10107_c0_g1_i2.p1  ORF type:complete len:139 (+),score=28.45 TRINITY_DN10107_c0_g1_i2:64-480(+)